MNGETGARKALKRIVVTGANGVGKTRFANLLASARPEVPMISLDALKLRTNWKRRPWSEVEAVLIENLAGDAWILEGGPSMLAQATARADALVWLDPPESVRIWRLAIRPWKFIGTTRPELPAGNVDWPWRQYRFAIRSIATGPSVRGRISSAFQNAPRIRKWRCRCKEDEEAVLSTWSPPTVSD